MRRPQVLEVLSEYGLALERMHAASAGLGRSAVVAVETSAGMKLLKRYGSAIQPEAVVHEHAILDYLQEIGFPAPRLARTNRDETFVKRTGGVYALFDYLDGYIQFHNFLFIPSQAWAFLAASAKALASLHLALEGFLSAGYNPHGSESRGSERWRDLGWYTSALDRFRDGFGRGSARPVDSLRRNLVERASWMSEALHELNHALHLASPPRLIIHGDYGPHNLLFKRGASVVILDFERARLDWRLADLSMALGHFAIGRRGYDLSKMKEFLYCYQVVCPIERDELDLLPNVWQYQMLRQVIGCCARYPNYHETELIEKAQRKLDVVDWLRANQTSLERMLTSR